MDFEAFEKMSIDEKIAYLKARRNENWREESEARLRKAREVLQRITELCEQYAPKRPDERQLFLPFE